MKEILVKVLFNLLLQLLGVDTGALDMCPELDNSLNGVIIWLHIALGITIDYLEEVWDDLLLMLI